MLAFSLFTSRCAEFFLCVTDGLDIAALLLVGLLFIVLLLVQLVCLIEVLDVLHGLLVVLLTHDGVHILSFNGLRR